MTGLLIELKADDGCIPPDVAARQLRAYEALVAELWPDRDPVIAHATAGQALGIPNRICYAMDPSRLLACSLEPGHDPPHNSRADRSGVEW